MPHCTPHPHVRTGAAMCTCAEISEEHFRTCAHGRTYPHVRMWGAVRNFWNFYCAGGVRCGRVKKCHRTRTLNSRKNLGKYSKKSVCTPHHTSQFFEKISPHCTSPHIIIFLLHPHCTAHKTSSKHMFFKGFLMCGGVWVRCGCGRKIMMWGEVRCGEIFSKNCEVRWGAETLFFEKC